MFYGFVALILIALFLYSFNKDNEVLIVPRKKNLWKNRIEQYYQHQNFRNN